MSYPTTRPIPARRRPAPLPRISRSTALVRTAAIGLVLVALVFAGLTLQLVRGEDPALGASTGGAGANTGGGKTTTTASSTPPPDTATQTSVPEEGVDGGGVVVVPQTPVVQPSLPAPTPVQSSVS